MSDSSPLKSRKFLFTVLVFAVASAFRVLSLIDSADWKQLAVALVALYAASNVAQKATGKAPA